VLSTLHELPVRSVILPGGQGSPCQLRHVLGSSSCDASDSHPLRRAACRPKSRWPCLAEFLHIWFVQRRYAPDYAV